MTTSTNPSAARVAAISIALFGSACVTHIRGYEPKARAYQPGEYAPFEESRTHGSLWSDGAAGLFEDARARRTGDILTIRIDERSDAAREATTKTSRKSDTDLGLSAFFGAMKELADAHPDIDPSALLSASAAATFDGAGSTARSGHFSGVLPVRIRNRLPNGDLYIEGSKVLLVGDEETHLYISGVVRPIDIEPDNSVPSRRLADVELEYTGRGVLTERQSPGWFSRVLDHVWPF